MFVGVRDIVGILAIAVTNYGIFLNIIKNFHKSILFLSFRRVLNVNCSFLGNSPASEF